MLIYLLLIAILVILDQITKVVVMNTMKLHQQITLIPELFGLRYVRNRGAAWSMLEGRMIFFYLVTIVAVGFFFYLLIKEGNIHTKKLYTYSMILIIAGALGNFIDRLIYQAVTDFLEFLFIDFPIFNLADIFLTLGTIGFAIAILFSKDVEKTNVPKEEGNEVITVVEETEINEINQ